VSMEEGLNRSQTRELEKLKQGSFKEFQRLKEDHGNSSTHLDLEEMSAGEIRRIAEKAARDPDCPEPLVWSIALEGNRQVPLLFKQTGTLKDRLRFNLNLYSTTCLPD
jgi:hypothetical protein